MSLFLYKIRKSIHVNIIVILSYELYLMEMNELFHIGTGALLWVKADM